MLLTLPLLAATLAAEPTPPGRPEVGLGFRNSLDGLDDPGTLEGPRLIGRLPLGPVTVEAAAFYRTNPNDHGSLTDTLVQIAYQYSPDVAFQQPYSVDRWSFSTLADWGFGERPAGQRFTAGPHLYGGVEVRRIQSLHASWNGTEVEVSEGAAAIQPMGVVGLGLDMQA